MLGPLIWLQAIVRAVEIVAALPHNRRMDNAPAARRQTRLIPFPNQKSINNWSRVRLRTDCRMVRKRTLH